MLWTHSGNYNRQGNSVEVLRWGIWRFVLNIMATIRHVRRRVIFCFLVSTIRKLETNKLSVLSAENATATAREGNRN